MKHFAVALIATSGFLTSGCSTMLSNLRADLEEPPMYPAGPTVGGSWSERGLLSEDRSGRSLASLESQPVSQSWMNQADRDEYRRDATRYIAPEDGGAGMVSFSNQPDVAPPTVRQYRGGRTTREDFVDSSQSDGSLWASDGQTNYYFTKNKVRSVGDIVTVTIEPNFVRDAQVEVVRTLTPVEREFELHLAQLRLKSRAAGTQNTGKNQDQVTTSQASAQNAPDASREPSAVSEDSEEVEVRKATYSDIDVSQAVDMKEGDTLMAEIVERYPNGNYKIRGVKRMRYRNNFRMLSVLAIVRGSDIDEKDMVPSGKLYEYRLEILR